MSEQLIAKATAYLQTLCQEIPNRRVGSAGNRAATDFFAETVVSFGFATEQPSFACFDWRQDGVTLSAGGVRYDAFASPYSLGCDVSAPLLVAETVEALTAVPPTPHLLLLRGPIASEQLMPKNFPFYNPDHHRQIIALLEQKRPAAIIAATTRDAAMVGSGVYPFPLFEDGDFDIPSVYLTDKEGDWLAVQAGQMVHLVSRAQRIPATGCNVVARKGDRPDRRLVFFAHIDAKLGTPGAADNASGVVVMLLLAELLADYSGELSIEIVALNGEDYYSNPGEQAYLTANNGRFPEIVLGVNVDGVGLRQSDVAYSLYGCPEETAVALQTLFAQYPGVVPGPPWYAGDHALFMLNERPALALTSEKMDELMVIVHTPEDSPAALDPARLVTVALALRDLVADRNLAEK